MLLQVLAQPEVLDDLRQKDPLAPARYRGLLARERLLAAEGGTLSAGEMADALGITRQAVDKRRKKRTLIGLTVGKRGYAYPAWQLGPDGVLNGLKDVLNAMNEYDAWTQANFMLSKNKWLEGETPLNDLRRGHLDRVLTAARTYGEQLAV